MYKYESCLPPNMNYLRQDMCTWWKREQYMAIHPTDLNFSGQMSRFYPATYPAGYWYPWSFNMGMNNMDSAVFPCFESGYKFCKSSRKCDKTNSPGMNKTSDKGFQQQSQVGSRNSKPIYSAFSKHGQFSPKIMVPPVNPSCFKQQSQPGPVQISPVHKPYKNPFNNSRKQVCRFCLQNGENEEYYSNHILKDHNGKVICPILRKYVCNICNATGDFAHTKAYCPLFKEKHKKPLAVTLKQTFHDSSGRIRK